MLIRSGFVSALHLRLDLGDDPLQVDVEPAAGRAGDHLGLGHAAVAGAEDVEAGGDLGHRVAQERDADRVADASSRIAPMPAALLSVPYSCEPASVMPTCVG